VTPVPAARRLVHPAITARAGEPLARAVARLSDRERVAVLLEGAAVLSHLGAAGWSLEGGLDAGSITDKRLRVRALPEARPGGRPPVAEIRALAAALWNDATPRLLGRGEGRAAARRLFERWRQAWREPSADHLVEDILDEAPFLFLASFSAARQALLAEVATPRLAGPAAFARRVLQLSPDLRGAAELVGSAQCAPLWRSRAVRGAATVAPIEWAAALARAGRFQAALALVESGENTAPAQLVAARCRWELGDVARAGALVRALGRQRLTVAELDLLSALDAEMKGAPPTPDLAQRRRLSRAEAARRWRRLAAERLRRADLRGSERATRHALVLSSRCDPGGRERGDLESLVEVLIRRGRLALARPLLEALEARPDEAANASHRLRALRARWLLAHGRAAAALDALSFDGGVDSGPIGRGLATRALIWLGRPDEAARAIEPSDAVLATVEPEERPALLAAVGRRDEAFAAAGELEAGLWRAALLGQAPPPAAWTALRRVDRYRAARWVLDLESVAPGLAPLYWRRRASSDLRRAGAVALAERIDGSGPEPWRALAGFLASTAAAEAPASEAIGELFAQAGYPDARLVLDTGAGRRALSHGSGGPEELSAAVRGGTLRLDAPLVDSVLRALFAVLARCLREEASPPALAVPATAARFPGIVGEHPSLRAALERAVALAPGRLPVLVLGETGTGKERAARLVHDRSERAGAAFLPLNCAALSETLVLSDLFGHVRGAFTGADRDRPGVFESARGGTVFLDEVGDLPHSAQGMLLRVLQEGEVRRLGESLARKVDVRVVAATNSDLARGVAAGRFRQDLYYRLAAARVELPPLRERGEDLWLLVAEFLSRAAPAARLTPAARERLRSHDWPGNVRELENAIQVAAALAHGGTIDADHLPALAEVPASGAPREAGYHEQVEAFRRALVGAAVEASGGNLAAAARRLGLTRQALSYLVRQLDLRPAGEGRRHRRG
jgi:two-component system response regulator HydG